jgi:hypothetical protein
VLSEDRMILDANDVINIIWIIFSQISEDIKFDSGLVVESLLVSDYLYSYMLVGFVVEAF